METQKLKLYAQLLNFVPKIFKLMDSFTLWKILISFLSVILVFCMIGVWENRTLIVNQIFLDSTKIQGWDLSDKTKDTIKAEVDSNPNVAWIVVTEMDLGANIKKFKFWYDEDQFLYHKNSYALQQVANQQIFDFNKEHTLQMISVLQNEFICNPFNNTAFGSHAPELANQTDFICRIAIPPFYGRFVGILTIGVKGPITDDVKFNIKSIAANISTTIYWRDVIKLPR